MNLNCKQVVIKKLLCLFVLFFNVEILFLLFSFLCGVFQRTRLRKVLMNLSKKAQLLAGTVLLCCQIYFPV